jgi:eukaryotic-like serine/threonine-protein kinase
MGEPDRSTVRDHTAPDEIRSQSPPKRVYGERYVIDEELGHGGMGRVFRAQDLKIGRSIALKILSQGGQRDRFEQEARAAGALNHPNILAVYDVGEHGGEPYIVSELLEGRTLRVTLRDGSLAPDKVLEIGTQLADGLAAAHRKGIVHRDLKPENLFLNDDGHLKILDFGVARLLPDAKVAPRARTDTGAAVGTPIYMSPEQVRCETVDARSDVFACGSVLYEMLTGSAPFDRPTSAEAGYAILHDSPAALPQSGLARIVGRCLEKDRSDRYADGGELLDDLHALAKAQRTAAGRAAWRRTTIIAGIMLASALALAFVAQRTVGMRRERVRMAVADFANDTAEKDLDSLSGMLITSLEQSRRLSVLTRSRMFEVLREMGKGDVAHIDEPVGRELARKASAKALVLANVRRFGDLYAIDVRVLDPVRNEYTFAAKEQGRGKESIPGLIDRLSEQLRAGFDERPADIAAANVPVARRTTPNLEAYRHLFAGEQDVLALADYEGAKNEFRKAIELDPDFALAHLRLVQAGSFDADLDRLKRRADRLPDRDKCSAEATFALVQGDDRTVSLAPLKRCADLYPEDHWTVRLTADQSFHSGDLDAAALYFEKHRATAAPDFESDNHLMWIWQVRGQFERMVADATERVRKHHDIDEYVNLVWAYGAAGDERAVEHTLQEMERLFPGQWMPFGIWQAMYLYAGEPEKAEALKTRPELDRDTQKRVQAVMHVHRGRFSKALTLLDELIRVEPKAGAQKRAVLKAHVLLDRGDMVGARKAAAEAVALGLAGEERFELHSDLGDAEAAAALLDSALRQKSAPRIRALFALAVARRDGNLAEEIALLEKMMVDVTHRQSFLLRLGPLYLRTGQPQKAAEALHTALEGFYWRRFGLRLVPINLVSSWYRLGQAYDAVGDRTNAVKAYGRVLRMWNDAEPALPELADARARVTALAP